jgi:hypothetical protein
MSEQMNDHIYVMAAEQPAYRTEVYHLEGPHHRVVSRTPDGTMAGYMEYKHQDGKLHPRTTDTGLYIKKDHDRDAVHQSLMGGMRAEHPGSEVYDPSKEPPPPPAKKKPKIYYHGTTVPNVTHILPAGAHGQGVTFRSDTDSGYAYATTSHQDAWRYAEKASDIRGGGRPRVYQVRPIGGHQNVEEDPSRDAHGNLRGNYENDHRSRHGFEVVREMKMPQHIYDHGMWRDGADPEDLYR